MTQHEALDILKLGHNVYITGAAGSGKTYLLNQYIDYLRTNNITVGITASTGIAATHMGGMTIHSWAGMGIRDEISEEELKELFKHYYLRKRFEQTKVLVIDEVSMLHAHRLDLAHTIVSAFKRNSLPFGGMQVILCGDLFQLPPVNRASDNKNTINDFICFSSIWKEMSLRMCYLDEQHRQDDRTFLRVLNDIRSGEVDEMTVEYLSERLNKDPEGGYVQPTRLFTHNADVDAINKSHLDALDGEEHVYIMDWQGNFKLVETLKKGCLASEKLILKHGARVMFVKNNYEAGYVNGTLGEVIGFDKDDAPIVRTFDGDEIVVSRALWEIKEESSVKASLSQFPLRLAWAITVHKSQGMSLDAAEVDLSRSFVPGMGYVALSRVRSLSGLKLMGMNQMALQIHPEASVLDKEFMQQSDETVRYIQSIKKEKKKQMQQDYLAYLKGS